jgi:hypothetical protein
MLDKQLGGSTTVSRAIRVGTLGLMGVLTLATMGLACYILGTQSTRYTYTGRDISSLLPAQLALGMTYASLYLAVVVVAAAFMLKTTMTLRTWRNPAGVCRNIKYYRAITNRATGSSWMDRRPHFRHGTLDCSLRRDCCLEPSRHRFGLADQRRSELDCQPCIRLQLHNHPLHSEARFVAQFTHV